MSQPLKLLDEEDKTNIWVTLNRVPEFAEFRNYLQSQADLMQAEFMKRELSPEERDRAWHRWDGARELINVWRDHFDEPQKQALEKA